MLLPTGTQMQSIDRRAIDQMGIPSLKLMERAGAAVAAGALELKEENPGPIIILCGRGNNGGDGLVAARHIAATGQAVQVRLVTEPERFSADAAANWKRLQQERSGLAGAITLIGPDERPPSVSVLTQDFREGAVIVDALLGTGTTGPPRAPIDGWIEAMNCCGRPILAVDVPSGVDADTGEAAGAAPLAHLTVTLGLPKRGLLFHPGRQHAGAVRVIDIGIPPEAVQAEEISLEVMTQGEMALRLPARAADAHKGEMGRLVIVAGSAGMMGAARLTCAAACRSGAGLVRHVAPGSLLAIAQAGRDEVMVTPIEDGGTGRLVPGNEPAVREVMAWADVAAFGPGLGTSPDTLAFLRETLPLADPARPAVFDADALNLMARDPRLRDLWSGPLILTPHPGEAARLMHQSVGEITADRTAAAGALAERYQAVVVLKGAPTVVAHPEGESSLCPLGNPGMATGGTGDVLTGIVAALLGQGLGPYTAACLGVYLHALAGDLAALDLGPWSLCAGDLVGYLPAAFGYLEAFPDRNVLEQGVWG